MNTLKKRDLPGVPDRQGSGFDRAVKERLEKPWPSELPEYTVQELEALTTSKYAGTLVRCSNGDRGKECLAFCDGFNWKIIWATANISTLNVSHPHAIGC